MLSGDTGRFATVLQVCICTSDGSCRTGAFHPMYIPTCSVMDTPNLWGHGGRVVTLLPPTSEAGVWFLSRPQVGKLVVACHWSAVYSTEP